MKKTLYILLALYIVGTAMFVAGTTYLLSRPTGDIGHRTVTDRVIANVRFLLAEKEFGWRIPEELRGNVDAAIAALLAQERDSLAKERNNIADDRAKLNEAQVSFNEERNNLAKERESLADERINIANDRVDLANDRTNLAELRANFAEARISFDNERDSLAKERAKLSEAQFSRAEKKVEKIIGKWCSEYGPHFYRIVKYSDGSYKAHHETDDSVKIYIIEVEHDNDSSIRFLESNSDLHYRYSIDKASGILELYWLEPEIENDTGYSGPINPSPNVNSVSDCSS